MQIDVIIQARTGSTRLPGKVLKNLNGKPLILRVFERTLKIKNISNVIIATTRSSNDDAVAEFAKLNNIPFFRGSEEDILDRFVETGNHFKSDVVIRGTGDNPFFDPEIANRLIDMHLAEQNDYTFSVGYPLGTSCEIFSFESLKRVNKLTNNPVHHEHLGTYFLDKTSKFKVGCLHAPADLEFPKLRLTVDTHEDFQTAENYLTNLEEDFSLKDIIALHKSNPSLEVNQDVKQIYPTESIKKAFTGEDPLSTFKHQI